MDLERLTSKYPELVAAFLNAAANAFVLMLDREYTICCCSPGLGQLLPDGQLPTGRSLWDVFCPLQGAGQGLVLSPDTDSLLPQVFKLCSTNSLYRCYGFGLESGVLIFVERIGSTDNQVLEGMSLLNNELSTLSRKISKKNRELEEANARISELMRHDPLTGLANRRYFQQRLGQAFALAQRQGQGLALIMLDLDHFKAVNDNYGHEAGDRVLVGLSSLLHKHCRTEDLAARFGGEEFIVLLPQTDSQGASSLAERIMAEVFAQDLLGNGTRISVSLGVTEYRGGDDQDVLLKRADQALYQAKDQGRNRVVALS
jgi:diguanylate cyclase (GGDEF)-like protein